jgi:hypothetical protein
MAKIEKISHLEKPLGSNNLRTKNLFYWRDLYKSFLYPSEFAKSPVDYWYVDLYYGRKDLNGYPVFVLESALKQITTPKTTVFVLNFVADAYTDFMNFINEAKKKRIISSKTAYSNMEPSRGWKSVHSDYHFWTSDIYQPFANLFLNDPKRNRKMRNFQGYMELYIEFVSSPFGAGETPITREKWYTSGSCSPLSSGLVVEIDTQSFHGDDSAKNYYLKDPTFYYITQAAHKFGFKLDKNAPWRFVADLDSKNMQRYMSRYGITKDNVYNKVYIRTYETEMQIFKHYVWSWYNEYIRYNPQGENIVENKCTGKLGRKLFDREVLTESEFLSKFSDNSWLRLFFMVRAKEEGVPWTQQQFDTYVDQAAQYYQHKGEKYALMYVYSKVTQGKRGVEKLYLKDNLTEEENDAIMLKQRYERNISSGFSF